MPEKTGTCAKWRCRHAESVVAEVASRAGTGYQLLWDLLGLLGSHRLRQRLPVFPLNPRIKISNARQLHRRTPEGRRNDFEVAERQAHE